MDRVLTRKGENTSAFKILISKATEERHLGRARYDWEVSVRLYLKK